MDENLIYFTFFAWMPMDKVFMLEDCYDYGRACVCSRARGVSVVRVSAVRVPTEHEKPFVL